MPLSSAVPLSDTGTVTRSALSYWKDYFRPDGRPTRPGYSTGWIRRNVPQEWFRSPSMCSPTRCERPRSCGRRPTAAAYPRVTRLHVGGRLDEHRGAIAEVLT